MLPELDRANRLITAPTPPLNDNVAASAVVARRERLGGPLNYYYNDAA